MLNSDHREPIDIIRDKFQQTPKYRNNNKLYRKLYRIVKKHNGTDGALYRYNGTKTKLNNNSKEELVFDSREGKGDFEKLFDIKIKDADDGYPKIVEFDGNLGGHNRTEEVKFDEVLDFVNKYDIFDVPKKYE